MGCYLVRWNNMTCSLHILTALLVLVLCSMPTICSWCTCLFIGLWQAISTQALYIMYDMVSGTKCPCSYCSSYQLAPPMVQLQTWAWYHPTHLRGWVLSLCTGHCPSPGVPCITDVCPQGHCSQELLRWAKYTASNSSIRSTTHFIAGLYWPHRLIFYIQSNVKSISQSQFNGFKCSVCTRHNKKFLQKS